MSPWKNRTAMLLLTLSASFVTGSTLAGDEEIVGYIGDEAVTRGQVSEQVAAQLIPLRQQEYDILSGGFDNLVAERLVEQEAEKRGVTPEELMKTEVLDKIKGPSTEAVDQFYETNKARMGGRTREQVGPDIENYLRQMEQNELQQSFLNSLRQTANVRILLDPPRVEVIVPAGEPSLGPENAPVLIVEFSDYQCPYCRRAHPTVEKVLEEYGDRVRFVYRDYPLPNHPRATPASNAARCAREQDKYWEYHESLMTGVGDLSDSDLEARATALELDMEAFKSCVASGRHTASVEQGLEDGAKLGVSGTPAFFINGRHLSGAQPYEAFKKVLDDELSRSAAASGSGAR